MAGNWMDDRERQIREREGRGLRPGPRGGAGEDRTWNDRPGMYGARRGGPDRDRVFGEGESGASYGGRSPSGYSGYRGGSASGGWQDRHYQGVSPAMRQGEYDAQHFTSQDYTGGGRFYGDDAQGRIYREQYGQGGVEYGPEPRGYDAGYSPTRARYHSEGYGQPGYGDDRGDRPASGGTGGYDYERGYGDGGRRESRGDRFEDAGRGAGEFLRSAGERVASWFGGGGEARIYDPEFQGQARGARGLGPQGYKRSDERINEDVCERLTEDVWLDASRVEVLVSGGEVTLSGTVESREAKHRAERIVEDVSGVIHVQNNLRLEKGNTLTRPGSGYGDSGLDAGMRGDDLTANGTGGVGGGQSTAGKKN
jgi:osmotically-inducible protein OsmY